MTKPGIIYGNCLSAIGGFLLASQGHPKAGLLLATIAGIALVMASGCVFNNYIDRGIDAKMSRTKQRALVTRKISNLNALIYGFILSIIGFGLLSIFTNILTAVIASIGFVVYVVVYGYFKRHSVHGTVVGSIAGAVPPVVGYCAVTNRFDSGALILFLILVTWQMPHFYAIAIRRSKDYKAAKIPVLAVVKGIEATKRQMVIYIALFSIATASLTIFGYTGVTYLLVMLGLGLAWIRLALKSNKQKDSNLWAKDVFKFSLIVLLGFSFMISVDSFLP